MGQYLHREESASKRREKEREKGSFRLADTTPMENKFFFKIKDGTLLDLNSGIVLT